MILEIHGAGFQNKGAELMLRTVVKELKQRLPEFKPAIDPAYGPYDSRAELGLLQIFPLRSHVGTFGFSKRFRQQKLFASLLNGKFFRHIIGKQLIDYGCVGLSSIQGLIDIAGFAYTDQWGPQPTNDFAKLTQYYKSRKKPVILLPQAFGPFKKDETRSAFKKVIANADLIFPRDRKSHEYVMELAPDTNKILRTPDITLFSQSVSENEAKTHSNYVCIVPNIRMLDQGKHQWGKKYETYLIQITKEIIGRGISVRFVLHDSSGDDLKIARYISQKISSQAISVIDETDPFAIKEMIGESLLLIGSRYHSLIAAFSKKVPAIALGWAHKYKMLFEDFGCEKLLILPETSIGAVLECVTALINEDVNLSYRHKIAKQLQKMHLVNQEMWERVIAVLTSAEYGLQGALWPDFSKQR
ncbi:MAG TPA: polysaccharide pyruvyl transferase family protein [Desulfobacteraceae bacterium]|nr:polysaccharide pyruvyl transferase family protein [Desulfobacteraceae bacterium]HPJ67538.1 polysaccharide pyruvyl transferase family protein [Desulfobacteraceae bacterium]HPQ28497.1 polysaccharide pyruvyl transferase family protein [Desulfobacteraceae bacterium]